MNDATKDTHFFGTTSDDDMATGYTSANGTVLSDDMTKIGYVNGRDGNDAIKTGTGDDLVAGDMIGDEWSFVDGRWVYDAQKTIIDEAWLAKSYDDVIATGAGRDILIGNGGHDALYAGADNDLINAGWGSDVAFGGTGDDVLNLEKGNDYAEGGEGADTINGGDGADVIYGDVKGDNLLSDTDRSDTTFAALAQGSQWSMSYSYGAAEISHSANTVAGETYTISFDLAANLSAGLSTAKVEVIWNGEVVETVEAKSGVYETFKVDVVSAGNEGELTFRTVDTTADAAYDFSGPVVTYTKTVEVGGESVEVAAFAAGQQKLYQVISGQLHVFDVETEAYEAVGPKPSFRINAIGFNTEDDLIYGVAKSNGKDSLGNEVKTTDIVMVDANGDTYRIGDGFYGDYVGDFDNAGNLWTFHTSLDRISVVDVDARDADGNPQITYHKFPAWMFTDRMYDIAYNAEENCFMAVVAPSRHGGDGKVLKIGLDEIEKGGDVTVEELAITGTAFESDMSNGMAKGAYGAVFFDGEGNLYYGMNNGDHDMNNTTGSTGGIFKVNMNWEAGTAYSEFMSTAPATGSNDGAVDPRSADAFAEVDSDAAVLLRSPELTKVEGSNDKLRGGNGNDTIYGNGGDDELRGNDGDDHLSGDQGDDVVNGDAGHDKMFGGNGDDKMLGGQGNDAMNGNAGTDYLNGGSGKDALQGGKGGDKLVGGVGEDVLNGGAGDDHIWGGQWTPDNEADVFVFAQGTGKDMVHDFEAGTDKIDLSAFGLDMADVKGICDDKGWATVLDLGQISGAAPQDKVILKGVELQDLTADCFLF